MQAQIFINLPVENLENSIQFYSSLGFTINPQFSDDQGKCMVWSENIFVMLLNHDKFNSFATKPIADTKNGVAALYSLSVESSEKMDAMVDAAKAVGGIEPSERRDYGFMQQRTIEDFDGHTWEIFFMDMSKFPG